MRSKDKDHEDALADVIAGAMNTYLRQNEGVSVEHVQQALGSILTETFHKFPSHDQRMSILDSFCSILRGYVEDMEFIERQEAEHDEDDKPRTLN